MADKLLRFDFSMSNLPNKAVSPNLPAKNMENSVPIFVFSGIPQPTRGSLFIDLRPKPVSD